MCGAPGCSFSRFAVEVSPVKCPQHGLFVSVRSMKKNKIRYKCKNCDGAKWCGSALVEATLAPPRATATSDVLVAFENFGFSDREKTEHEGESDPTKRDKDKSSPLRSAAKTTEADSLASLDDDGLYGHRVELPLFIDWRCQ